MGDDGSALSYTYSAAQPNQPQKVSGAPGTAPTYYAYDGRGDTTALTNTIALTNPQSSDAINTRIAYDAQARPVQIVKLDHGSPLTITLGYNADGLRDRYTTTMSGTTTLDERFGYRADGLGSVSALTATLNADGSVKASGGYTDTYINGPSGEPLEFVRTTGGQTSRYFYVLDGHGSVVAVTDASGKVVDRYNYDLWGESIGKDYQTVPQEFRYRGYWWDGEVQWYWLGGRHYDPEAEVFLQPDPTDLDGVHSYVYANDDPIDYSDPLGYWPSISDVFHRAVNAGKTLLHVAGKVAYASWNLVAGDDIKTLCCTSKPWRWDKTLAAVNIVSLFFPPDALVGHGAEIAVKLGLKAGAHAGLGAVVIKLLEKVGLHVGGVDEAAIDAELRSRAERGVVGVVVRCATCFAAGTVVATPHGEQAIETLRVGDKVWAEDPARGTVEPELVQAVIQDPVSPLMAVTLGDGNAITTTVTHAFWVDEGPSRAGWLEAGQLRVGDRLREMDGTEAVVAGLRYNVGQAVVYTLTVAKDHTFFVSNARVLVHNALCGAIAGTRGLRHSFDEHAAQWFGRNVNAANDLTAWQELIERAAKSNKTFPWSTGADRTIAAFARIDGKPFLVQFYKEGPRAGELATAFVPNQDQLRAIFNLLVQLRK